MTTPAPPRLSASDLLDKPAGGGGGAPDMRGLLPSLAVNAIVPFVVYTVLTGQGVPDVPALMLSGVFPVLGVVWGVIRARRADPIGLVSLTFIVIGVVTSFLTGDARFILIKASLLTGVFGLVCLLSLLAPRPIMFYFGRTFSSAGDPARAAAFGDLWQYPQFRAVQRNITLAWGIGFVAEASTRVALALVIPIPIFLVVSPVLGFGVTFGLIAWTIAYVRRASQRGAAHLAEAEAARTRADA